MQLLLIILSVLLFVMTVVSITKWFYEDGSTSVNVIVELPLGKIKGRKTLSATNRTFYTFQGIPFAAPPVGELRFKAPVPPNKWNGIFDATDNKIICYQTYRESPLHSEDCLYLNVYTPELPDNGKKKLLPVMLYIHGGRFNQGNSLMQNYGPGYLIDGNIVIVTINYRLGPFGFLSSGDSVISGNYGLKDQHMAIKWTYDNIRLFGGDSRKITIFGQSAGSASVTLQLLNKKNEGLLRGAICMSGSFLNPWTLQRRSRDIAFRTAQLIDPNFNRTGSSQSLLEFLLRASANDIHEASVKLVAPQDELGLTSVYGPVIEPEHEDAFISEKLYVALKQGNIIKVPTLMGFTSEELLFLLGRAPFTSDLAKFDEKPSLLVPFDMRIEAENKREEMGKKIRKIYVKDELLQNNLGSSVRFFSDTLMNRGIIRFAEMYSRYSKVYFYQFSYDGNVGDLNSTVEGVGKAGHGADLTYIFRHDNSDLNKFPESYILTHKRMQKILIDFVTTLNPTPTTSALLQNITWPVVTPEAFLYVDIDVNLTIRKDPKRETYKKWVQLYDSLGFDDFDTY